MNYYTNENKLIKLDLMPSNVEVWKYIDNKTYNKRYQVSNFGNVRSLNYRNKGDIRPLSSNLNRPNGYSQVYLYAIDGKRIKKYVHRLVMNAFGGRAGKNQTQVNHINEIKTCNNVNNLEWCTASENIRHSLNIKNKVKGA